MQLYNSLTRKKEEFRPQDPKRVTMYTCGPTVYGPSHVGHARTYVNFDLLKRVLEYGGYKVRHVLNITDVHDDMIEEARKQGTDIKKLANRYIEEFYRDLGRLNVEPPDLFPRVTEQIGGIIKMVQDLIDKGYAYERDGSVYFDVSKFKKYGKLSGIKLKKAKTGTRVDVDKHEKEEAADFALWKGSQEGDEEVSAVWDSPWGKGRPGWHIECSVMSREHLGETLDIHGGALDLRFPHHENEIAQSEAVSGKRFVNYWVHAGLLTVEGQKMAKSLGNYIRFDEIVQKDYYPLAFRYLVLTAHYRSELNFTWASLEAAQKALDKLRDEISTWDSPGRVGCAEYENKFEEMINDDLDIPGAVALMWELVKVKDLPTHSKMKTLLKMDKVFGLKLSEVGQVEVPEEVRKLIDERERLREEGNWEESDKIRDHVEQLGYRVEDSEEGPVVKKVKD
ncbi:cysteine--tRNA ligase [Candidatus Saccharibacteria bacterium]|nr:cysteine--tRNA ligase [Candidatus Saccharibacteria bacterium]